MSQHQEVTFELCPHYHNQAKQEHAEQEEMTRTTRLDLESELAAYKKANLDMEKTLQGMKIKNRMDRDAMNDIHMQTIKVSQKSTSLPSSTKDMLWRVSRNMCNKVLGHLPPGHPPPG